MTHTQYRVTCDNCNRREYSEGDDTETDALLGARANGWRRRTVQNGATWDFCPRCEALIAEATDEPAP
jgi:hypothetical protein